MIETRRRASRRAPSTTRAARGTDPVPQPLYAARPHSPALARRRRRRRSGTGKPLLLLLVLAIAFAGWRWWVGPARAHPSSAPAGAAGALAASAVNAAAPLAASLPGSLGAS